MRYEEASALHDLLQHRGRDGREAEDGRRAGRRHRYFRLLRRASAGGRESVSSARRPHRRPARIFWEDQREFDPPEFFSSLLKQVYLDDPLRPAFIHVPVEFEDCASARRISFGARGRKVEIHTPQRGQKKAMLELVESNAQAQLRAALPRDEAVVEGDRERLQDALGLENAPRRIECFDISHIQGTDKVASMVVWEDGRMKKSDYRKFIIRTVEGNDDFASMREVITRRYGD
jgi:excinuclease ABC subunit C